MNADSAGLHDPKGASNIMLPGDRQEICQAAEQTLRAGSGAKVQNDNAGALFRREAQHLAEIPVERYQHTAFRCAHLKDDFIGSAGEPLFANGRNIVTSLGEEVAPA